MIFSRSKKLTRDREAGLVFRWRGGLDGNRGGMTLALLITAGLFTMAFVGLNVKVRKVKPPQRRVAKIMMVPENDERMSLWVDIKSPFPARWDPLNDAVHHSRVESELANAMAKASMRDIEWRALPEGQNHIETPELFHQMELVLPELSRVVRPVQPETPVMLEIRMGGLGELSKRRPDLPLNFKGEIPAAEFGKQFRWFITLNKRGEVVYLAPVEPLTGEFPAELEAWLRGLQFKPSDKDSETGELVIRIGRKRDHE